MRVALDVRPLQTENQYRGVGTYVRELLIQYLTKQREVVLFAWPEIPISLNQKYLNLCQIYEIPKPSDFPGMKYLGFRHDANNNLEAFKKLATVADLIHFTNVVDIQMGFPMVDLGVPRVATVHDITPVTHPQYCFYNGNFLKFTILKFLYSKIVQNHSQLDGIITVSQYTDNNLHLHLKNSPPTKTVWNGISDRFVLPYASQVNEYRQRRRLPAKFILHVGALLGVKNIEAILQATAPQCPWPFVFAGPYSKEDQLYLVKKFPHQQIVWLGYVEQEELPMLYAAAGLFAFPSLMEGFGLPLLEAMAVGTPVVCSNTSCLPEVVGNAAVMFDPRNLSDVRNALLGVMNDENLRMQMRTRGLERAQHMSWRRTADMTWMAYEAFLEEYQRRRSKKR